VPDFININGKLLRAGEAGIPADNRAFRYGYGLIETMLVRDGSIRLEQYHWERLFSGMGLLGIGYATHFREDLAREVRRTVQKNKREEICRVRLQVYAGNGGFYDGDDFSACYVIETFPLEKTVLAMNENGLVIGISDVIKHTGAYAHLKTCNALPYILAARQAKAALWNDALLRNEHGNVADSTIANIFCIKGQKVYTPPLSEGCVSGVMRGYLLEILPRLGYKVVEQPLQPDDFSTYDGAFLCNAIRGLRWIRQINTHMFQPDTVGHLWRVIPPI
jgi:branched-chain amino acid aminotransferase